MVKYIKATLFIVLINNINGRQLNTQAKLQSALFEETVIDENIHKKLKSAKLLITNGINFINNNSFEHSCQEFINNFIWRKGELYIAIYDSSGICYAHGEDNDLIWHNFSVLTDITKNPLIKQMFDIGKQGGIIIYFWNNAYKVSYVKSLKKNGKDYVFEVGYFPQDAKYACTQLVSMVKGNIEKNGIQETYDLLNTKSNPFVIGQVAPFIYSYEGILKAGGNPILIDQNFLKAKDEENKFYVQDFIQIAKSRTHKGWKSYFIGGVERKAYIENVIDPKTKTPYAIIAAYFPDETYRTVKNFVEKAVDSVLQAGPKKSFSDFNSTANKFKRGNLTIFAYDKKGLCKANGSSPNNTGQNFYNTKNKENRYIVREMIELLKNKRSAWISYASHNSFTNAYIQKVVNGRNKTFIIGSEFYPSTKKTLTETIVSEAAQYLKQHPTWEAFRLFSQKHSWFSWGDQFIFVYDIKGTCLVNGYKTEAIWRNFLKTTDQDDKLVVGNMISTALDGGGWYSYRIFNSTKYVYLQMVEKEMPNGSFETFILGSGYFI